MDYIRIRSPCNDKKCWLKCSINVLITERQQLFKSHWKLGDLNKEILYISLSKQVKPKYRYEKIGNWKRNRSYINAFYFTVENQYVWVCKHFFKALLDINDRIIRTVLEKSVGNGIIAEDDRGKHNAHLTKTEEKSDVHAFINSVPRIESHYLQLRQYDNISTEAWLLHSFTTIIKLSAFNWGKGHRSKTVFPKIFHSDFNI